jgi:hypothetical protein
MHYRTGEQQMLATDHESMTLTVRGMIETSGMRASCSADGG